MIVRTDTDTSRPLIILLAGPTAVGKTELSIRLARSLDSEIVNADSMQVYRHMNIGAAKPTPEERTAVPHHLIDVADPDEPFDAARYTELAHPVLADLHRRRRTPLVVGGAGLYMKALTRGICEGAPSAPDIKERLIAEVRERGLPALYFELSRVDPSLAARLHPNDRQRIVRALEVFRATGKPLSLFQDEHRFGQSPYRTVKIFLTRDREELYERIDRRVVTMLGLGFVEEVRGLLRMGYGPELKPMQALGYGWMVRHIMGEFPLDRAVSEIQKETRRYAKRQMTWFRGDPEFQRIHAEDEAGVFDLIRKEIENRMGA